MHRSFNAFTFVPKFGGEGIDFEVFAYGFEGGGVTVMRVLAGRCGSVDDNSRNDGKVEVARCASWQLGSVGTATQARHRQHTRHSMGGRMGLTMAAEVRRRDFAGAEFSSDLRRERVVDGEWGSRARSRRCRRRGGDGG